MQPGVAGGVGFEREERIVVGAMTAAVKAPPGRGAGRISVHPRGNAAREGVSLDLRGWQAGPTGSSAPHGVNRAGFLGGILAWITRLGQAPPSERSSALRLQPLRQRKC